MAKRCYYEVLGVSRGSGEGEIKSAFRRLAKECHPDRCNGDPNAEKRFKEVNEAYEALKDPQRRAAYDRYGHAAFDNGLGGGGAHGFGADFSASMSAMFDDLFGEFMGAQRRPRQRSGRERGADLRYNMEITLSEAYEGKTAQIRVPTSVTCDACSGSGAKAGTSPTSCRTCGGIGKVRASQGFFTIERTCPTCQGRGETIETPCPSCSRRRPRHARADALGHHTRRGRGRHPHQARRRRRGGIARRTARRSLHLPLHQAARVLPTRRRRSFCRVPIAMTAAALGGQIEVPTIDGGKTRVKIPEGTETGKQFRLKAKGMPVLRSKQQGDLYIQVEVETPKNLSRKQRDLLKSFEDASNPNTSPASTGFFARVKEFFEGIGE